MAYNYKDVPGVRYIAGVTFQSEYGVHPAGSDVPEAPAFWNLDSLVDNRFLWPYAPDEGYDWLPPHLFNEVRTRDEVEALLKGDPHGSRAVQQFPDKDDHTKESVKPAQFAQAEFEADQQPVIRAKMQATDQPGNPKDPGPSPVDVATEATKDREKQDQAREARLKKAATPRTRTATTKE
jgi:hypothetical protein